MLKIIISLLIFLSNIFSEDFITKSEYAKMLYENPRGISCVKCHKLDASGKLIANYDVTITKKIDGKIVKQIVQKSLIAPPINNLPFERFKQGILNSKGVMPSYFLTNEEIEILYYYVNKFGKKGQK